MTDRGDEAPAEQQQQDDPDVGVGGDEVLAGVQRQPAAPAERRAGEQTERNRREPDPARDAPEQAQRENRGPESDER